jgi:hypothetical protein
VNIVRAAACVVVLVLAVVGAACAVSLPGPDHEFHNYQTAVAQAPKQGWTAYWLGRSFQAGGMTFKGPAVADFGDEIPQGGIAASYNAGTAGELEISVFSAPAWSAALRSGFGGRLVGSEQQTTGIAGATATVTSGPTHNEGVRIDIDFGDTHVLARVGPTFALNGEDVNPINNVDAFIAVLQHLRPYPQ